MAEEHILKIKTVVDTSSMPDTSARGGGSSGSHDAASAASLARAAADARTAKSSEALGKSFDATKERLERSNAELFQLAELAKVFMTVFAQMQGEFYGMTVIAQHIREGFALLAKSSTAAAHYLQRTEASGGKLSKAFDILIASTEETVKELDKMTESSQKFTDAAVSASRASAGGGAGGGALGGGLLGLGQFNGIIMKFIGLRHILSELAKIPSVFQKIPYRELDAAGKALYDVTYGIKMLLDPIGTLGKELEEALQYQKKVWEIEIKYWKSREAKWKTQAETIYEKSIRGQKERANQADQHPEMMDFYLDYATREKSRLEGLRDAAESRITNGQLRDGESFKGLKQKVNEYTRKIADQQSIIDTVTSKQSDYTRQMEDFEDLKIQLHNAKFDFVQSDYQRTFKDMSLSEASAAFQGYSKKISDLRAEIQEHERAFEESSRDFKNASTKEDRDAALKDLKMALSNRRETVQDINAAYSSQSSLQGVMKSLVEEMMLNYRGLGVSSFGSLAKIGGFGSASAQQDQLLDIEREQNRILRQMLEKIGKGELVSVYD